MVDKIISDYFSELGKKGGKTKGKSKLRGGSEYYKALASKRKKKTTKSA